MNVLVSDISVQQKEHNVQRADVFIDIGYKFSDESCNFQFL